MCWPRSISQGRAFSYFEFCSGYRMVLPMADGLAASWQIQRAFGLPGCLSADLQARLVAAGYPPFVAPEAK